MLFLYYSPGSSSLATHIALHEIGVPFESRSLSFHRKEHREPWFLAINPEGKVPTLLIDGRPLTEVAGTLYYLARAHPEAGLMPAGGAEAEAHAISWMSFIASSIHHSRTGMDGWKAAFAIADGRLAGHDWVIGDRYSIADIHLFRLYWRFVGRTHPPAGTYPNLDAQYERMMARPAVKKTFEVEAAVGYELPP